MFTQAEFDAAHDQWYKETRFHSFPWTIMRGEGFEKVKAFGTEAIPFLIRKLRDGGYDVQTWGILAHLVVLTKEDISIKEVDGAWVKTDVESSVRAWIKWGEMRGLI